MKLIRAKLYVNKIDYNTVIDLAMPYIVKELSDKDNFFFDVVTNIISNKGKPSGFSKLLVSLIPNKNNVAASILPHFDEILKEYLNEQLTKYGVTARIKSIRFDTIERSHGKVLKIEITVDEIDYEQTAVNLIPLLLNLSEKEDQAGKFARLLLKLKELPANMLTAAIEAIPKWQRDELLADILMEYQEELAKVLNEVIEKNDVKAQVSEIKVVSL
jgi:hypothetical protein